MIPGKLNPMLLQDDYLDCYGDPKVIGKVRDPAVSMCTRTAGFDNTPSLAGLAARIAIQVGTDIQDKKCSWLVVQALKLATPEQRKVIEENYGVDDEAKIKRIKDLYKEMKLEEVCTLLRSGPTAPLNALLARLQKYLQYEEETYQALKKQIAETSGKCPAAVFDAFLAKIFKRQH